MEVLPREQAIPRIYRYLLALILALVSNYLFTGEWITRFNDTWPDQWSLRHAFGTVLLLASIAVAAFTFGRRDDYSSVPMENPHPERMAWGGRDWIPLIPSAMLYLLACLLFLIYQENSAVRWCWFLSILLLLLPLVRRFEFRDFWPIPFWEYLLLMGIMGAAFTLRYVDLTRVPYHVDNDVSIMGLYSREMLDTNNWKWVGMAITNHQYSEHQFLAWSMRLFGRDHYGLVMLSVLAGTATVGAVHFCGKILFNRWVGLIAAALLAFNYVHVHFSRIVFGPISTFFVVLAGLFLMHGVRRGSPLSFALGGASLGAGMLGYYSARVGPVIAVALFLLWFWQRKSYPKIRISHWLLAGLGLLVVFGPNLVFSLTEAESFHGRGHEVILWTEPAWKHSLDKYGSDGNPWVVIYEQVKRALLAPFFFPDSSTICYLRKPMAGVFTGIFFALGIGYFVRRIKSIYFFYPLVFFGLTFLCGGILTTDPPFWPHLNIAVPAIALIAAVGAERLSRRIFISGGTMVRVAVPSVLISAVLFSGVHNWEVYYRFARDHAGARILAMRQIERLPADYRVYLLSPDIKWEQETFQFFGSHVEGSDITEEELLNNPPAIEKPTVFFLFEGTDQKCIDLLTNTYPGTRRRAFFDGWEWPAFTMFEIFPKEYVEMPQRIRQPAEVMWNRQGWRYVSAVIFVLLMLGWVALYRDLKLHGFPQLK